MPHGCIATLAPPGDRSIQLSLISRDATASVNPSSSIEVDDVDAAYEEARASGLEIVHELSDEEWGVRRFFFQDTDGNVVNVLSHLSWTLRTNGIGCFCDSASPLGWNNSGA